MACVSLHWQIEEGKIEKKPSQKLFCCSKSNGVYMKPIRNEWMNVEFGFQQFIVHFSTTFQITIEIGWKSDETSTHRTKERMKKQSCAFLMLVQFYKICNKSTNILMAICVSSNAIAECAWVLSAQCSRAHAHMCAHARSRLHHHSHSEVQNSANLLNKIKS